MSGDHARLAYEALAPAYDRFTEHHDYVAWTATLERLARAAGLRGRRLLDVACGTGKSFEPFLARGYAVTACDVSPAMAARAAAKAGGRARVVVCDMRELPGLGEFDLACCLDDGINYLHARGELVAAFAGIRRNLAPGGILVFDANTLATYRSFFGGMTVVQSPGEVLVWNGHAPADLPPGGLAEATLDVLVEGADGTWSRVASHHRQRHHPGELIEGALAEAGLRCAARHGMHLDGSVTESVDELANSKAIYVARRAASSP
jgi:SAM-dependent methyltransferase